MRLLYLHYGPQSGVTEAITGALAAAGVDVVSHNPVERFLYQLRPGSRIPNARPAVIRAVLEAVRLHGPHWKSYYLHTPYAFDHVSREAARAIRRAAPDRLDVPRPPSSTGSSASCASTFMGASGWSSTSPRSARPGGRARCGRPGWTCAWSLTNHNGRAPRNGEPQPPSRGQIQCQRPAASRPGRGADARGFRRRWKG